MATACMLAAIISSAVAEDETEATTFGKDGIATQGLGLHYKETGFSNLGVRADGGLVAQQDNQVEYFLVDGKPDPAVPPQHVSTDREVVPLAGGKSLVIEGNKLTRVNSDGSVDTSFGGGAVQTRESARTAAELASGQILLIGTPIVSKQTSTLISIGLVNPDGTLDPVTGENASYLSIEEHGGRGAGRVMIAPAANGGAFVSGNGFLLALRADGSLDPSFAGDGLVEDLPFLVGVRVLADGSVAAVGSDSGPDGNEDLVVLRYTSAGTPDNSFGPDGIRRFDLGGKEEARAALWAADDSVIVGGSIRSPDPCPEGSGCEEVPVLVGFSSGGDLAEDFASGGVLKLAALAGPFEYPYGKVEDLARRPDGSIVAAGSSPPIRTTAFLAAVSAEGTLLPGFGEGGIVRERQAVPAMQWITGIESLEGGKLLAAGTTDIGVDELAVLIRYAANGSLDRSFGAGAGFVAVGEARSANGFAIDSERVLMSTYANPRSRLLALRAADGEFDSSFGADGAVLLPKRIAVEGVGFATGGAAVVVASRLNARPAEPGVVLRYLPNGEPDPGFGGDGRVGLHPPSGWEAKARALVSGGRGRTLVAGVSQNRFTLTRLLPDGRSDPRFGSDGWVLTGAGRMLRRFGGIARSAWVSRVGSRIYLAGVVRNGERFRLVLLRLTANGRLDPAFGRGGRRIAAISEAAEPKAIMPSRGGVLVVLSRGPKPLILFGDGEVQQRALGGRGQFVSNVRATAFGGQLVLGWNGYSRAIRRSVYHLGRRPLP
jgi:uncharacterized delta-60 repeat protein